MGARNGSTGLREVRFQDFEAVADLKARSGWPRGTAATWRHLFLDNPAIDDEDPVLGWVVERDGNVVGYFGTIRERYRLAGRSLRVGAATALCVDPACRGAGHARELVAAWKDQRGVDLVISTTSSPVAAKIFRSVGALEIPCDYSTILYWVTRPRGFAEAALRRQRWPAALARGLSPGAALAILAEGAFRDRGPRAGGGAGGDVQVLSPIALGVEVEDLWRSVAESDPRLLADRSPDVQRWHYADPSIRDRTKMIGLREGSRLRGWVTLLGEEVPAIGLSRARIVDLIVRPRDESAIDDLLAAAFDVVRGDGAHGIELLGFPDEIRRRFSMGNPLSRRVPDCPFFWYSRDAAIRKLLGERASWYPCPYDGDGSLFAIEDARG